MKAFRILMGNIATGEIAYSYISRAKDKEGAKKEAIAIAQKDYGHSPQNVPVNTYWIEEIQLVSFPEDEERR